LGVDGGHGPGQNQPPAGGLGRMLVAHGIVSANIIDLPKNNRELPSTRRGSSGATTQAPEALKGQRAADAEYAPFA
jgi:hypothetical protein